MTGETATVKPRPGDSFGSIEGSDEYVARLMQVVEETSTDVAENLRRTRDAGGRRREALRLVAYKLEQLRFHLATSRRRLRDLRTLRCIVEGEPCGERERREGIERCA